MTQHTFLQCHTRDEGWESEEHLKAWLLRVTINRAGDLTTSFRRKNTAAPEDYRESLAFETPEDLELFRAVMALPEEYRAVIHPFYYEEYSVEEIARILKSRTGTVKRQLSRGRALLKTALKEEWNNDD